MPQLWGDEMDFDFTQFFNPSAWGSFAPRPPAPAGYTGPAGDIGYGVGVGATGPIPAAPAADPAAAAARNNLMQRLALGMLQPQQIQAPQIQMARPVGPGQLPQQQMQPQDLRRLFAPGGGYGF
jgi:hypothetical protein